MSQERKVKGFTIIEVVLVLAIAGLIFLMVFIALPALQRSQRDTQRKNDLSRIATQITAYSSNNRGAIPTSLILPITGTFVYNYLGGAAVAATQSGSSYVEPTTGNGYTFLAVNTATSATVPAVGQVAYDTGRICGVDGAVTATGATARNYTLRVRLESQTALYCIDNR